MTYINDALKQEVLPELCSSRLYPARFCTQSSLSAVGTKIPVGTFVCFAGPLNKICSHQKHIHHALKGHRQNLKGRNKSFFFLLFFFFLSQCCFNDPGKRVREANSCHICCLFFPPSFIRELSELTWLAEQLQTLFT